jgi:cell division protein FtsN
VVNRRPQLQIVAPAASPEEAAAVVAALERFMRDTAPPPAANEPKRLRGWQRAALLDAVDRRPHGLSPWGDAEPWG